MGSTSVVLVIRHDEVDAEWPPLAAIPIVIGFDGRTRDAVFKTASRNSQRRVDERARNPRQHRKPARPQSDGKLSLRHNELLGLARRVLETGKHSPKLIAHLERHVRWLEEMATRRGIKAEQRESFDHDLFILKTALRTMSAKKTASGASAGAGAAVRTMLPCPTCSANVRQDRLANHVRRCHPARGSEPLPIAPIGGEFFAGQEAPPTSPSPRKRIVVPSPTKADANDGDLATEVQRLRQENAALKANLRRSDSTAVKKKRKQASPEKKDAMDRPWSLVYAGAFDSNRRRH